MVVIYPEFQQHEIFELPNNWDIEINYGFIFHPRIPDNTDFINAKSRSTAPLRKCRLYKQDILIDEITEDNPLYIEPYSNNLCCPSWHRIGEEFERIIKFSNGFVFKIEYWYSKKKQEPNRGIYYSNYRKLILFNEKNQIISEVMEKNWCINPTLNNYDYEDPWDDLCSP